MRALTYTAYGPIDNLSLEEVAAPRPRLGELLVDVHRAALNPKDALVRKGKFSLLSGRRFPKRVGLDYAGTVRESHSPRFRAGDRVFGMLDQITAQRGTLAEQVCVRDEEVAHTPEGISDEDAAAVPLAALTALQALRDIAQVKAGTRVWIHGASGGVGTLAIQIARLLGTEVTTTTSAANRAMVTELGAQRALDYRTDFWSELAGRIDVVFDVFGNLAAPRIQSVFDQRGVIVSTVPTAMRLWLELATRWHRIQRRLVMVRSRRTDLAEVGEWLRDGRLRAVIDSRYPLARARDAFVTLESKRARGKLIIEIT